MNFKKFYYQKIKNYDGEICDDCNKPVACRTGNWWRASDDLWKRIIGNNQTILCPLCFTERANYERILMHWEAVEGI